MNNNQVAKVVHAALSALDETQGSQPVQSYENLTEQQRTDKHHEITGHVSRLRKRVDADSIAQTLPDSEKLKFYITAGITEAFARYENTIAGGNQPGTVNVADINNPVEPQTVDEAMAKADADAKQANASAGLS